MSTRKFKANDRVKRAKGSGCHGIVREVKEESTTVSQEQREKSLMIHVLWDNGSFSCFSQEALVKVD